MKRKVVLALSGGMDSTTLLGKLLHEGNDVKCLCFYYASKHNEYENKAAAMVAEHYGVNLQMVDLSQVMSGFTSALLKSGGEIPEGHYTDSSMSQTVVPFRNGIFLSIMAGLAESIGADSVAVGIHQGDHAIYPDCREVFYKMMNNAILAGTDNKVHIIAPFLNTDKIGILQEGFTINVPYHLTRTCYKDQPVSCGNCGSCNERKEAFNIVGVIDPIPYSDESYLQV